MGDEVLLREAVSREVSESTAAGAFHVQVLQPVLRAHPGEVGSGVLRVSGHSRATCERTRVISDHGACVHGRTAHVSATQSV